MSLIRIYIVKLLITFFCLTLTCSAFAKFKDLTPIADAHVASGSGSNQGSNGTLFIQSSNSGFGDERAYLKFNLSDQIPAGATISSGKLRLYAFDASINDMALEICSTSDAWDESTIIWSNQPNCTSVETTGTFNANQEFLWYEFDVTSFVQSQFTGDQLVSLLVKPTTEGTSTEITYRLNAKEFIRDGYSFTPKLRVEYTGNWPSTGAINIIHTNDIHSRLSTHDYDFPDGPGEAPLLEEAGGAAYLAAKVVELKKANPDSLYLDAGDISEGNPLGDLRGNGGTVDFFQELNSRLKALPGSSRGIDAIVVGNHDVREALMLTNMMDPDGDSVMNTPANPNADPDDVAYISVNIVNDGATKPVPSAWPSVMPFRPYVVVTIGSSKVGVLGYTTDDSAILTSETVNVIDVLETAWTDKNNGVDNSTVVLLEEWVEHLRKPTAQGGEEVDMVVLLSHIGHRRLNADGDVGFGDANDELLGDIGGAATSSPPDLVVSGHWHTWSDTAWQPSNLNYKTTNVEASSYSQYVGEVTLTPQGRFINANKHAIRISDFSFPSGDVDVDNAYNAVVALLTSLESEYDAQAGHACTIAEATIQTQFPGYTAGEPCPLDYVVGYSADDLTLDKDKWFTLSEFPWSGDNKAGEWITDAMAWKVNSDALAVPGGTEGNTAVPAPAVNPNSTFADLAFQSGGGIRRDNASGELTYREIFEAYPWDDDQMVRVQMSDQDIWNFIEGAFVGASISSGWTVTADDGLITAIAYDHDDNDLTPAIVIDENNASRLWNVIISEFMYENEDWINETGGGFQSTFTDLDNTPDFLGLSIRDEALVPYTSQFTQLSPMTVEGPRYILNTEIAGEFEAVVTMTNDFETQPFFEGVFVRFTGVSAETIARRNLPGDPYGLANIINVDGTIKSDSEFKETLWYRSHLGFPDGYLQVGDRVSIKGEFGFFNGNAQIVEQEGIQAAEEEFDILGNDPSLAAANYFATTAEFMQESHENHLVTFYATRASNSTVQDAQGDILQLYREGGFFTSSVFLPGNNGDCLQITGVSTERADGSPTRRFRLRDAMAMPFMGGVCFPPTSMVTLSGPMEIGSPMTLTASSEDLNGFSQGSSGLSTFFSAMDLNGDGQANPQEMLFSNIDISSQTGLQFEAQIAEADASDNNEDWDATDFVHIDYQIDNGGWLSLLWFESDLASGFNSAAFEDTDFNGIGDGVELTPTLTTFTRAIAGTGSSLDLRITFSLESGDEDIAFDNIKILNAANSELMLEDFEDAIVEYTLPLAVSMQEFNDGFGDHFTRTDGTDIGGNLSYIGGSGSSGSQLFGSVTRVEFFVSTDGGETFTSIGIDNTAGDGFTIDYTPIVAGDYQFYSVATDDDGLVEMPPVLADAVSVIQQTTTPAEVQVPSMPWYIQLLLLASLIYIARKGLVRSR